MEAIINIQTANAYQFVREADGCFFAEEQAKWGMWSSWERGLERLVGGEYAGSDWSRTKVGSPWTERVPGAEDDGGEKGIAHR